MQTFTDTDTKETFDWSGHNLHIPKGVASTYVSGDGQGGAEVDVNLSDGGLYQLTFSADGSVDELASLGEDGGYGTFRVLADGTMVPASLQDIAGPAVDDNGAPITTTDGFVADTIAHLDFMPPDEVAIISSMLMSLGAVDHLVI